MADSNIAITAGTGTNVDTRTNAGGDHRQVVVIGDETTTDAIADVRAADPASNLRGVVVRDPNSTSIVSGLRDVRVQSIVDGTVTVGNIDTITRVNRVMNLVDGTISTVSNITTGNLNTITRVDRVMNVVDGTISLPSTQDLDTITRVDRVINLVDGTISTISNIVTGDLDTITRVDRVHNVVDGTLSTVQRVQNVVDGTLSSVYRVHNLVAGTVTVTGVTASVAVYFQGSEPTVLASGKQGTTTRPFIMNTDGAIKVYDIVTGTISTVSTVAAVTGITNTVAIAAKDGTFAVYFSPSRPVVLADNQHTASIFTVSSSVSGSYPSGKTVVAPSANYSFKVFAIAITTTAQAGSVVQLHNGGETETEFWRYALQAPTQGIAGANLSVTPPAYIFATGASTTLAIQVDSGSLVHYSVSYIKESV